MLDNSTILITGGTGSFGRRFIERTLRMFKPKKIIIYSRDEMKQWEMASSLMKADNIRYFIGDVRDKERLHRACQGVDFIVHAAALKIVPVAEYNPFDCIKTNVHGAMNVIDCAINNGVRRVVALSTDKAVNPINLYGATKLCSDKLFVAGNAYVGAQDTRFSIVRYGNVIGSRGSIIPLFKSLASSGEIPITDPRMTRFMITLDQGVELVWHALQDSSGGEIYVKKVPSMRVVDIARIVAPSAKLKFIGIRPGEKLHELLISVDDARTTYEYETYYKIFPQIRFKEQRVTQIEEREISLDKGRRCADGFCYSSDTNLEWMDPQSLAQLLETDDTMQQVENVRAAPTNEPESTIG